MVRGLTSDPTSFAREKLCCTSFISCLSTARASGEGSGLEAEDEPDLRNSLATSSGAFFNSAESA